jgi:DNA-binding transcriptional LysR family regulator
MNRQLTETDLRNTLQAVADAGSMTRAARRMFMTPEAIFYRIRLLEKRTGIKMLEQGARRRAKLTPDGQNWLREQKKEVTAVS